MYFVEISIQKKTLQMLHNHFFRASSVLALQFKQNSLQCCIAPVLCFVKVLKPSSYIRL